MSEFVILKTDGAQIGGLESVVASRGSKADSRVSNWTKLDSTADSIRVEPSRIHQVRHGYFKRRLQAADRSHSHLSENTIKSISMIGNI